jgi:serine palmitoyltransferase
MIVGSVANSLCSAGGFCAGSKVIVDHQRINGTSFVFSAAMPAAMAVGASESIRILTDSPSILATLQENIRAVHNILDKVDCITIPSHSASPIIHIQVKPLPAPQLTPPSHMSPTSSRLTLRKSSNPSLSVAKAPVSFDIDSEERLLQAVVEEALAQGVMITRAKHLRGQEMVEPRPSIRLAITAGLTKKECEKCASVVKAALIKVLSKRR